jgi:hypothetical protein
LQVPAAPIITQIEAQLLPELLKWFLCTAAIEEQLLLNLLKDRN